MIPSHLATGHPMWNILVSYCSSGRTYKAKDFEYICFPELHLCVKIYPVYTVIHSRAEPLWGKTEMLRPEKTVRPDYEKDLLSKLCIVS